MSTTHLIAVDLDGTLLTDDKKISKQTKDVLMKAQEEGHYVVIATGRPQRASIAYYQELQLKTPMVNFNGAYVHHPLDRSWGVHHHPIDLRVAKAIFEACSDFKVKNVMAAVLDDVYLNLHDERFISALTMMGGEYVIKTGNLQSKLTEAPTSMLIYPDEDDAEKLRSVLTEAHAEVAENRSWGPPWNIIEIVKSGQNKAVGLKRIAEDLHIPRERIIAFGDENNDLEMIDYAGQGVAMGNAIDELKNAAKAVTKTNQEDGIAVYLKERLNL